MHDIDGRILELELMHHWTAHTCRTLDESPKCLIKFATEVPQYALANDFLLDGLFSFTALHLASQRPSLAEQYIAAAVHYRNRGLRRAAPIINDLPEQRIVPLCLFSGLIGLFAMAHAVVSQEPSSGIATLVKSGELWRGQSSKGNVVLPESFR